MTDAEWNAPSVRSLAVMYNGNTLDEIDPVGRPVVDDSFLVLMNAHHEPVGYTLPESPLGEGWEVVMDTRELDEPFRPSAAGPNVEVGARSLMLLSEPQARSGKHR